MYNEEKYINHETRIRILEKIAEDIDKRFNKLDSKMSSQFHWVLGTILAQMALIITLFGGIILHTAKLV